MFDQERADRICDDLSHGKSLRKAAEAEGIAASTVLDWTRKYPEFGEQYARARETGYQLLADELVEIADDGSADSYVDADGKVRTDAEVVARSRLRLDTRKWLLSKMLPKVYGDRVHQMVSAPDGGPVQHEVTKIERVIVDPVSKA